MEEGATSAALVPGDRLGPYEIVGSIGAGGMGEVFRATDTRLGRDVAVKVLPPSFAAEPERLRRFEVEARAVAALDHPNVLVVHDVGAHEGREYIVTELLEGESLRDKLDRGRLPPRKAVEIAIQVARGLAAAHEKGIVHRDLKPENVFLIRDGRVKVIDFGLARVDAFTLDSEGETQTAAEAAKTAPGVLLGTVTYMSPEQARGRPAGAPSDVFALGAVLYEMLAGRRPFSGGTLADTLSAILHEDPPPIETASAAFPSSLDRVVRRCLEKEPTQRFQTAGDVGFALEALTQVTSGTTSGRSTAEAAPEVKRRKRGTAVPLWRGLALVAMGALAAVTARWWLTPPSAPRIVNYRALTGGANGEIVAFATDGERVYFTLRGGRETRQVALNGGASAPLALPFAGGYVLDASKERSSLLMQQDEGAWDGSLWSVPLPAGGARKLGIQASGASWSPDGQQLAFVRWKLPSQLATARGDGSKPTVLFESPDHLWGVTWSPDGQRLRFGLGETDSHHYWIMEIPATGGVPRRLFQGFGGDWSPDGTFIFTNGGATTGWENAPGTGAGGRFSLFAALEPRALRPWEKPRVEQLTFGPLQVRGSAFGRGGRGQVVLASDVRRRLMRYDAKGARFSPLLGGLQGGFLDYSWDGRSVAWVDANELTLWRSRSDGSDPLQLTTTSLVVGMLRWSPDGKKLAFVGKPEDSPARVYVISSDGGAPEAISPPEKGQVWDPGWLPDGKTVVWGLVEAGGIRAFDLEKRQLSVLPGTEDLWFPKSSRQGLILAVTRSGSRSDAYWTYDPRTGRRENLGLPNSMSYPTFTRDGQSVIGCSSLPLGIYGFDLRDRHVKKVADLDSLQTAALAYGDCWVGLDPDDAPIVLSDSSTYELYALDWDRP